MLKCLIRRNYLVLHTTLYLFAYVKGKNSAVYLDKRATLGVSTYLPTVTIVTFKTTQDLVVLLIMIFHETMSFLNIRKRKTTKNIHRNTYSVVNYWITPIQLNSIMQ